MLNVFILQHRDAILNNYYLFFHFLFGRCVWLSMPWCVWMSEGSFQGRRLSPTVGSGDAAWAVGHAQQALLCAELSCWPPTLVFKSSSVLWYFLVVGLKRQRFMLLSFIFFQPFGQCALKPFVCSLFLLGSCSAHLAHDFCSSVYIIAYSLWSF